MRPFRNVSQVIPELDAFFLFLFVDRRKLYGISVSRPAAGPLQSFSTIAAIWRKHYSHRFHLPPPPPHCTTSRDGGAEKNDDERARHRASLRATIYTRSTTYRHHVNGNLVPIFDLQRFFHLHHVRVFAQFQSFCAVSRQFQRPAFFLLVFDFAREYRHHLVGFLRLPVERFPRSKWSRGAGGFVQDIVRQLRTGLEERSDRSKVRTHSFVRGRYYPRAG